jgi:flagellar hook-associated protein 2
MGTVVLSFGSATSGAGFDVSTTVTSILAIQQSIETPWKTQLTSLQAQDTAFSTLGTDLGTLSTSLSALTDLEGVTAEKDGSSSNTSAVSLSSASATAAAGSHTIVVNSLAQTSSVYSNAIANASDTLSGSLSIQVGSGSAQTVTVDSSSNTLSTLAAAINSAGIGVAASIISDANGSRLSLVSSTGGSSGQLTVASNLTDATTATAVSTQTGTAGANASLTVDGVEISSASNTVSTAIPGVTFQLLSTSSSPVQVQITNDTADISTAVNSFVTAYNTVVGDLAKQEGKDSSGNAEPLYGNPTVSSMQSQLSQALLGGAASGSVSSITQMGITVNQDGTLTFSQDDLDTTLNSSFSDAVGFLQNTGSFGTNFTSTLNGLSSTDPTGAIYLAEQQNTSEEATLNDDVTNEEALLATENTSLTTELNTANETLQSIPSQLSEVNEMYSAVTGYDENSN